MTGSDEAEARPPHLSLIGLFVRFLRFGARAFGGPVAQIAMIRQELVEEERWIDGARFNRLLAVMQALPGPEAHELGVHMGIRARGRLGGLLAGLGFMLPGLILMLMAAWAYSVWAERVSLLSAFFAGVQATVLAVIVRAVHRIGEHILTAASLWIIAFLAAAATAAGGAFWIVLIAAGLAQVAVVARRWALAVGVLLLAAGLLWLTRVPVSVADIGEPVTATATATLLGLFLAGLKGGLLTFGGAYTAIPFVRQDTVGQGLATDQQFLDGVGLANALPAPLVIFATFVGWMAEGLLGALMITAGMFLPAFAFSMIFYERLEAIVENLRLQTFLAGVAAAVVGIIAVTMVDLGRGAAQTTASPAVSLGLFLIALAVVYLWKSRFNALVAVALGAAGGGMLLA